MLRPRPPSFAVRLAFLIGCSTVATLILVRPGWAGIGEANFEATGVVSWENTRGQLGPFESEFSVTVSGDRWRIALTPVDWPQRTSLGSRVPDKIGYVLGSDGENVYQVSTYAADDLAESQVEQIAERWEGCLPMDRGSHKETHALWYAFVSGSYCSSISGGTLMTLEPRGTNVYGTIERNSLPPGLPSRILATNLAETARWRFSIETFTNWMGLALPLRGELETYSIKFMEPWSRVEFETFHISAPSPDTQFQPSLYTNLSAVVYDTSHRFDEKPFKARFTTNQWPSAEEVEAAGRAQLLAGAAPGKTADILTGRRLLILLAIACLAAVPFACAFYLLVHRLKPTTTSTVKKP